MKLSRAQLFVFFLLITLKLNNISATTRSPQTKFLAQAQLGRLIFFDKQLSLNKNQSCASCHNPPSFADPGKIVSNGSVSGQKGNRNAPTAAYASFSPEFRYDPKLEAFVGGQFWDGRAKDLIEQAKGPFLNSAEMAMPSKNSVIRALSHKNNPNNSQYQKLFPQAFGLPLQRLFTATKITDSQRREKVIADYYHLLATAIAAYEKTSELSPFNSKYDLYLAGKVELTAEEKRGEILFNGKAKCLACHVSEVTILNDGTKVNPLFTDFTYDNIGIPKNINLAVPNLSQQPVDLGLGGRADLSSFLPEGIAASSFEGSFKVPTLRNLTLTAPYGHNGYFATLKEIVHFYNTSLVDPSWPEPEVKNNVNVEELGDLGLSDEEENDLVKFLETLTDIPSEI
jgi:cytochrome c peroxidase